MRAAISNDPSMERVMLRMIVERDGSPPGGLPGLPFAALVAEVVPAVAAPLFGELGLPVVVAED